MKKCTFYCFSVLILVAFFPSCFWNSPQIIAFDAITNYGNSDTIKLPMSMENVVLNGITLPGGQHGERQFEFSFEFNAKKSTQYYYKIYYQNETYKFPETIEDKLHPYCNENFYGSWPDVNTEFKPISQIETKDRYTIVGNPRDEKIYYGGNLEEISFDKQAIENIKNAIKNTPEWYESIKKKAKASNKKVEQQLFLDAVWMINNKKNEGIINHRWKRNPRVGCYDFLLVVVNEDALAKIPQTVKNIGSTDENGQFLNPFYYFIYGEGSKMEGVFHRISSRKLKTIARINPMEGVYINPAKQRDGNVDMSYMNSLCNNGKTLYHKAHFEQFSHAINRSYELKNIPEARDVINEPYTQKDYYDAIEKYDEKELVSGYTYNSVCPCRTVKLDTVEGALILCNPGNDDSLNFRKENVGVKTRIGFTYGKFRGKIKFPKLINEENVWNGLTNAFWMIYQGEGPWNKRRAAEKDGYIPKNNDGKGSLNTKQKQINYSEIDIEIVKTSPTWNYKEFQEDDGRNSGDVIFCCTNWDLANQDPVNFFIGDSAVNYENNTFQTHRWSEYYKAITSKHPKNNDEMFGGDYFYYEIEWKPTEIIWRAGPTPDSMEICGYMNDEITSIPNNQMVCVITQEFHYAEWWPYQPFSQNWVPYPKNDIEGKVFEIVVE